jgi:hypothetical protein
MRKAEMIIPFELEHTIQKASMGLGMQGFFVAVDGRKITIEESQTSPSLETQFSPDDISVLSEKGIQVRIFD